MKQTNSETDGKALLEWEAPTVTVVALDRTEGGVDAASESDDGVLFS